MKTTALATAAAACSTLLPSAEAQPAIPMTAAPAPTGPFSLPPLPYAYDALEPHIDAQTMQIHHDKHHQAYITNLNKAVAGHADLQAKSVEELLAHLGTLPESVRTAIQNNGGGHYNHSLFWQMMKKGGGGAPSGELSSAIDRKFKSFDGFKSEFSDAAAKRFGSGWAWLVLGPDKQLAIESSANQDTPWSAGKECPARRGRREHAYYLNTKTGGRTT